MDEQRGAEISLDEYFYGVTTVGERGQVVIPAQARRDCGLEPGDKLLVFRDPMHTGVVMIKVGSVQMMHQMISSVLATLSEIKEGMPDESEGPES